MLNTHDSACGFVLYFLDNRREVIDTYICIKMLLSSSRRTKCVQKSFFNVERTTGMKKIH